MYVVHIFTIARLGFYTCLSWWVWQEYALSRRDEPCSDLTRDAKILFVVTLITTFLLGISILLRLLWKGI